MWYIFIAVLIVIAVMLVFLLMAIRLLAAQARTSLNAYFMKNLQVYDELEANRSQESQKLQEEIEAAKKHLAMLQKKSERMEQMTMLVKDRKDVAGGDGVLSMGQAVYRDNDFMDDYAYVRSRMQFSPNEIMANVKSRIHFQEDEKVAVYTGIQEKFPPETLYEMVTLPLEEQKELLDTVLSPMEQTVVEEYLEEMDQSELDMLEFMDHIDNYVRSHQNIIHVRRGRMSQVQTEPGSRVLVEQDDSVHEGLKIVYKNQLYDYSI
jgi:hypothetical protein